MNKFVIRGKSGLTFICTDQEKFGEEETYETIEDATLILNQMQDTLPFEELEIIEFQPSMLITI